MFKNANLQIYEIGDNRFICNSVTLLPLMPQQIIKNQEFVESIDTQNLVKKLYQVCCDKTQQK